MNTVMYFEIQADDPEEAITFYTKIFDWKFIKEDLIPIDYYRIQTNGINGGLLKRQFKQPPPMSGTNSYVCSIEVESFDKTADEILKNGGQIALKKFAVPGRCWQGYFIDTQGNTFGIFQVDENAK